jgi:hypothetical protein
LHAANAALEREPVGALLPRRPDRLLADVLELPQDPLPVLELAREVSVRLLRLEEPEEEGPEGGVVARPAVGLGLPEPAAHLLTSSFGGGVGLRASRPGLRLLDELLVEEAGELRVDLAVARRPRVGERLLEVLDERIAGAGAVCEGSQEGVAKGHWREEDMSDLTCQSFHDK